MNLPPPPWKLYGWAGLLIDWIDAEKLNKPLFHEFLSPRKRLGNHLVSGHYFGSYRPANGTTFQKPFHEFGYITSEATFEDTEGFYVTRMAVDHPAAMLGGKKFWGVEKVSGKFEEGEGYALRVNTAGGRVRPTIIFERRLSLGFWEKDFSFLSFLNKRPIHFRITYYGEVFYCGVRKKRIWNEGRVIPLLFDNCWITMHPPKYLR